MNNDPVAIARASYEAYARKDRPAIEALIAGYDFVNLIRQRRRVPR
jgi:hypothetical protein